MPTDSENLTKEQLLNKLGAERKDELIQALGSHFTKDELLDMLGSRLNKDDLVDILDSAEDSKRSESDRGERTRPREESNERRSEDRRDDKSLDWNAQLAWAQPPAPTPAPVRYTGAPPSFPGERVRVDLSGLPMLGIFAGRGASAAGTITGVDARRREVRVYLDAVFDGQKEIVVPPERVIPES
ncbi:MAG TPA: hypothetical protein VF002_04225 [Gaiellaceae bacterium]